jgi:hypothetical protein
MTVSGMLHFRVVKCKPERCHLQEDMGRLYKRSNDDPAAASRLCDMAGNTPHHVRQSSNASSPHHQSYVTYISIASATIE